jgi:aspartate carbamoyltransferase regulatory subunit
VIDRGIHCDSYVKNPLKTDLIIEHGNIFDVAEKIVPSNLRNVPLECMAKTCLFNKEERCHANGITIVDESENADCATFCEG